MEFPILDLLDEDIDAQAVAVQLEDLRQLQPSGQAHHHRLHGVGRPLERFRV